MIFVPARQLFYAVKNHVACTQYGIYHPDNYTSISVHKQVTSVVNDALTSYYTDRCIEAQSFADQKTVSEKFDLALKSYILARIIVCNSGRLLYSKHS